MMENIVIEVLRFSVRIVRIVVVKSGVWINDVKV